MPINPGIQKQDRSCPLTTWELKMFDPPKAFFQHWQMTYCTTSKLFAGRLVDSGCEWLVANACHLRGLHSSSSVIRSTCQSNPPLKYPIVNSATHDLEVQYTTHAHCSKFALYQWLTINAAFKYLYLSLYLSFYLFISPSI